MFGAIYQVNLNTAAIFQDNADVPGVRALPLEGIVFLTTFFLAGALMLRRVSREGREA